VIIRLNNDMNTDYANLKVVCCLPEEIETFFTERSSNHLKDLSPHASVSRIRWQPIDLLRIVAMRYREFITLYAGKDDKHFVKWIKQLELSRRDDIKEFFAKVMPDKIANRFGHEEPAIPYIIRHTQLLPREVILIFDAAIVMSHRLKGTWRFIEPEAIVKAVEAQEPYMAREIMNPYEYRYPELLASAQEVLPDLPPICSLGELDGVIAHIRKRCQHETDDPRRVLFDIGILGYLQEENLVKQSSVHYEYGYYHFNSIRPITFASSKRYCIHPIFSGSWGLVRPDKKMKSLYPADIKEIPWDA
jgi:hypothetical protein